MTTRYLYSSAARLVPGNPNIPYQRWIAVNREYAMRVAKSAGSFEHLATELRLLLLAEGRMNKAGHAIFEGERGNPDASDLRRLMGLVDKKTGEVILCSRQAIYRAKRKLADAGILVDESGGLNCVWVATEHAVYGFGGNVMCPFHQHYKRGYADRPAT
jgi:hypothetical protein